MSGQADRGLSDRDWLPKHGLGPAVARLGGLGSLARCVLVGGCAPLSRARHDRVLDSSLRQISATHRHSSALSAGHRLHRIGCLNHHAPDATLPSLHARSPAYRVQHPSPDSRPSLKEPTGTGQGRQWGWIGVGRERAGRTNQGAASWREVGRAGEDAARRARWTSRSAGSSCELRRATDRIHRGGYWSATLLMMYLPGPIPRPSRSPARASLQAPSIPPRVLCHEPTRLLVRVRSA
jgi:hypothetical protein